MSHVSIRGLEKVYKSGTHALAQIDLEIKKGEFIALVGPSGCGKSTLLRTIAGLESPTQGTIEIAGKRVDHLHPADRGVAMVFQDYALYPHMSVSENLAFGLKLKKTPRDEIKKKISSTAEILEITHILNKKPSELSGGQRQRVAIGRAMVKEPEVFLLDEPLSNLDAQLRAQTRAELVQLHRRIQSTTIYVTHDQEEAMVLADRVVVLKGGRIQQIGIPIEVYQKPANQFVGSFIGNPQMNFIRGELQVGTHKTSFCFDRQKLDLTQFPHPYLSGEYILGFRPESIVLDEREPAIQLDLEWTGFLGHEIQVVAKTPNHSVLLRTSDDRSCYFFENAKKGFRFKARLLMDQAHWFDADRSGKRIANILPPGFSLSANGSRPSLVVLDDSPLLYD